MFRRAIRPVAPDTDDGEARRFKAAGRCLLGYAEQNVLRRSFHLTGAAGARRRPSPPAAVGALARRTPTSSSKPLLRCNVVPNRAGSRRLVVDVVLGETGERARPELRHGVLRIDVAAEGVEATLRLPRDRFLEPAAGSAARDALRQDDTVEATGEPEVLASFLACFDPPPPRVRLHARRRGSASPLREGPVA
ncbi:alkyl sulfatase C-terminal domain-containing protein [Kitasatospora griseola]|uniref:alkyl sulfatase C-terminal domain-containing protein n=1 Tax=Kitasatospora griseola TaxID=2064 RepID=UPI0036DBB88D